MRIKKFNECFLKDDHDEINMLYSLLRELEITRDELESELEKVLLYEQPSYSEMDKRTQKYNVLVLIVQCMTDIGKYNNQLFLYTGE